MSEPFASGFVRLDNAIVDDYLPRAGAAAFAVLAILLRHADIQTRVCYPSLRRLARTARLSQPTVLKAIATLETDGYVKVERKLSKDGRREVNRYTLLRTGGAQAALAPALNQVEHHAKAALAEQDLINKTEENKREGGRAERPPTPVHTGDPNLDHPAVKAYRDAFKLTPNALQRAEIARVVTDVATWQEALRNWQLAGYKKNNIPGLLDKYWKERGERSDGDARSGRPGFQGNGVCDRRESRPPETPEEAARRDAEWEALVRKSQPRSDGGGE